MPQICNTLFPTGSVEAHPGGSGGWGGVSMPVLSWASESDHRILGHLLGRRNPTCRTILGCCRSLVGGVHTSVNIQRWRRKDDAVDWPGLSPLESFVMCLGQETRSKLCWYRTSNTSRLQPTSKVVAQDSAP